MDKNFAVITLGGKQHLVTPGAKLTVNRLQNEEGKAFTASEVFMVKNGEKFEVGTPNVASATVSLKVLGHQKAKKVTVAKFRAKSRYRRKVGHRQPETTVEVVSIKA